MTDKIIKTIKALIISVLCFAVILCPVTSFADEVTGSITLTVADKENKVPVKDAVVKIYKFAEATETEDGFTF